MAALQEIKGESYAQHGDPQFPLRPESKFPWPILAIIAAGAILAVFIYLLPRLPKQDVRNVPTAGQIPDQPFGRELQVKNITVQPAPTGGAVVVAGDVVNTGSNKVAGVTVQAEFLDSSGKVVQQDTQLMQAVADKTGTDVVPLVQSPLSPNEIKPFRIAFSQVPENWNHQAPRLRIMHVTFEGQEAGAQASGAPGQESGGAVQKPASDQPPNTVNAKGAAKGNTGDQSRQSSAREGGVAKHP
jgi:hypothetical protein